MRILFVAFVAALALPTLALAQPEYRQRQPTGGLASADPCANVGSDRAAQMPEPRWPGFDSTVPAPAGATSFTGIASPGRDPSRGWPDPPALPDQAYQDCVRRQNR